MASLSHQSLKKGHREGKNIPPGQIPLYRDVPGHHLERWEQGPDYANGVNPGLCK